MASDEEAMTDIIRGLVLFGRETGVTGGSVSPVIVLHRVFRGRFPLAEPSLTAWIVDNRVNEYEPFGFVDHGNARSMAEWDAYCVRRDLDKEIRSASEVERQAKARDAKNLRERVSATAHLANAVRRGDLAAVTALLAKGADPVMALPGGSLIELAEAKGVEEIVNLLRARGRQ